MNIFKTIDTRLILISEYYFSPSKPKSSFGHLKRGIQDFHMKFALVSADDCIMS